jgi:hypothetical protein
MKITSMRPEKIDATGSERTGNRKEKKGEYTGQPVRPRLLPLKKAAEYLGVTEWQLRTLVWNGQIPVVRFPNARKQYFEIVDLDELVIRNKVRE